MMNTNKCSTETQALKDHWSIEEYWVHASKLLECWNAQSSYNQLRTILPLEKVFQGMFYRLDNLTRSFEILQFCFNISGASNLLQTLSSCLSSSTRQLGVSGRKCQKERVDRQERDWDRVRPGFVIYTYVRVSPGSGFFTSAGTQPNKKSGLTFESEISPCLNSGQPSATKLRTEQVGLPAVQAQFAALKIINPINYAYVTANTS